jgi:hypothetical protein
MHCTCPLLGVKEGPLCQARLGLTADGVVVALISSFAAGQVRRHCCHPDEASRPMYSGDCECHERACRRIAPGHRDAVSSRKGLSRLSLFRQSWLFRNRVGKKTSAKLCSVRATYRQVKPLKISPANGSQRLSLTTRRQKARLRCASWSCMTVLVD